MDDELHVPGDDADEQEQPINKEMERLRDKHHELRGVLDKLEEAFHLRCNPIKGELFEIQDQLCGLKTKLELLRTSKFEDGTPPGPACLRWVGGEVYNFVCITVILLNLLVLVLELSDKDDAGKYWLLDQMFLVWYVKELVLKILLFQGTFFCGRLSVERAFYWLDVAIVLSGIIDQWVLPVLHQSGLIGTGAESSMLFNPSALRALRVLRVTRMLRACKAVHLLLHMDLAWTDGKFFDIVSTTVIFFNSIVMGIELDIDWWAWRWVNLAFLGFYLFELLVKMKRHKWNYFTHPQHATWHVLDFVIVVTGLIEMLALPAYYALRFYVTGQENTAGDTHGSVLSVIRILRLLRILRLYRLLTFSPSLKKLVLGIADAMHGTFWVILLTFLVLYIFAIIFTTLVGQGMVFAGSTAPDEAEDRFGSVEQSLYMLFKLMNDDQSVVMFTDSVWVRLLFMVSMVVLNWVMLATLTSVVTDQMNSSTHKAEKAESETEDRKCRATKLSRLQSLFQALDTDGSGIIEKKEFEKELMRADVRKEFWETAGLKGKDLAELFEYLCHEKEDSTRAIVYEDFIEKLMAQGNMATERAIYRLESQMRQAEQRNDTRFQNMSRLLSMPLEKRRRDMANSPVHSPRRDQPQRDDWKEFATKLEEQEEQEKKIRRRSMMLLKGFNYSEWDASDDEENMLDEIAASGNTNTNAYLSERAATRSVAS